MIASQSELLPAVYSTATADSVAAFVAANYDLPAPLECILLQRGFNDSFSIRTPDRTRYATFQNCHPVWTHRWKLCRI